MQSLMALRHISALSAESTRGQPGFSLHRQTSLGTLYPLCRVRWYMMLSPHHSVSFTSRNEGRPMGWMTGAHRYTMWWMTWLASVHCAVDEVASTFAVCQGGQLAVGAVRIGTL